MTRLDTVKNEYRLGGEVRTRSGKRECVDRGGSDMSGKENITKRSRSPVTYEQKETEGGAGRRSGWLLLGSV